jgi:hypothetical protein
MPNIAATLSLNVPAITALCKGAPGTSLLYGGNNPTTQGNNGDFYLNNVTYELFGPKAAGAWPAGGTLLTNTVSAQLWNVGYTVTRNNSGDWENTYISVSGLSANWSNAYTTVRNNSAVFTEVQGNSANWRNVYTQVRGNSAAWGGTINGSVFTTVQAYSANWQNTYNSVSALSASWGTGGGGPGADLQVRSLTANWENTWVVTRALSSNRWSNVYLTVSALSADWSNAYTQVRSLSSEWNEAGIVYNYVNANSGAFAAASTYTINNSASIGSAVATVSSLSSQWDTAYDGFVASAQLFWNTTYNEVLSPVGPNNETRSDIWTGPTINFLFYNLSGWRERYIDAPATAPFVNGNTLPMSVYLNGATVGINYNTANADLTAVLPHDTDINQTIMPVGTRINLMQIGTSQIYVSGGRNITLNGNNNRFRTRDRYTVGTLIKTGSLSWVFYGDTVVK